MSVELCEREAERSDALISLLPLRFQSFLFLFELSLWLSFQLFLVLSSRFQSPPPVRPFFVF